MPRALPLIYNTLFIARRHLRLPERVTICLHRLPKSKSVFRSVKYLSTYIIQRRHQCNTRLLHHARYSHTATRSGLDTHGPRQDGPPRGPEKDFGIVPKMENAF